MRNFSRQAFFFAKISQITLYSDIIAKTLDKIIKKEYTNNALKKIISQWDALLGIKFKHFAYANYHHQINIKSSTSAIFSLTERFSCFCVKSRRKGDFCFI